jgi:hypothetical protein
MSVWEAVTTGFDGGFVPRTRDADAETRRKGGVGWVDVADEEVELSAFDQSVRAEERKETLRAWRISRCWDVLDALGPAAWSPPPPNHVESPTPAFAATPFTSLAPGEQRLVLLMRALVGRPPLVLLDEVWSGMDEAMIRAARRYLRGDAGGEGSGKAGVDERQAVVVITHWEEEVPWVGDEVKRFRLGL